MVWKPLRLSSSAGAHLLPLLISASFTPRSYTIHLTDLTHIWSESLDQRAIIRRSNEENTSIDPSADSYQFQIFLDKIKLGLAGAKDTTLALTITADANRPSLVLNITVKLPGGLSPLQWPVQLAAAPQSLLTSQLTVPLLRAQHVRMQEMANLAEVLREKDHVIQKLVDKLEGQGTELGQIFPQAAGKVGRKLDRKRAEERVKGLGQFDMEAWRKRQDHGTSLDTAQLIGNVFAGDDSKALGIDGGISTSEEADAWWESIKGITVNLDSGKISTNGPSRASRTPPKLGSALRKEETIDEADDFQVQATPRHLASPPKRAASKLVISDSTDDDDDLDALSQRSKIPDSFPPSPPPAAASPQKLKKLGAIGGKKLAPNLAQPDEESTEGEPSSPYKASSETKAASPTPEKALAKPQRKLGRIGGKKEDPLPEPESEHDVSPPLAKAPVPDAPKVKKGKLGQIGGKKKRAETPAPAEEAVPETEAPTTPTTPNPKRKLGVIGHRHQSPAIKNEDNPSKTEEAESRGRASVKPEKEKSPPPRETSQERADRKRLQLKRELEEKAKAPVKKRRKF
jgi:hypothetical protein